MAEFDGGLKVRVFGAGVAEPIQNAQVRIYNTENTELYSTFTDEAGETEIFVLPAPDPAFSENGGEQPYAVYNAEINADGYIPLRIEGVQVFPDVISIQRRRTDHNHRRARTVGRLSRKDPRRRGKGYPRRFGLCGAG